MESLSKVIRVVEYLATREGASGVREVARAANVSPASAHRILRELAEVGWVQRPKHSPTKYELTGRVQISTLLGKAWPDDFPTVGKLLDETEKAIDETFSDTFAETGNNE